nr:hypothetical protein [Tanacetum cinerariifolium]
MLHGSSLWEPLFVLTISINITSLSSPLVQTSLVLEDWGTNPSDSKNELSLRAFSVMNEIDGSGGMEGLTWIFLGFPSLPHFSSGVTKIILLKLKSVPLTSCFVDTRGCVFHKGLFWIFHAILSVVGTIADLTWGSDSVHLSRLRWSKSKRYYVVPYGELNGIPVALVARFGVVSKSTDMILVFYGG